MPLRVQCPNGCVMRVPANRAGMSARCPGCKSVVVIPFPPTSYDPKDLLEAVIASSSIVAPADENSDVPIATHSGSLESPPPPLQPDGQEKQPSEVESTEAPASTVEQPKPGKTGASSQDSTDSSGPVDGLRPKKKRKRKQKPVKAPPQPPHAEPEPANPLLKASRSKPKLNPPVAQSDRPSPKPATPNRPLVQENETSPNSIGPDLGQRDSPIQEFEISISDNAGKAAALEFSSEKSFFLAGADRPDKSLVDALPNVNNAKPVERLPEVATLDKASVTPPTFRLDANDDSSAANESKEDAHGLSAIEIRTRRANADRVTLTRFFAALLLFVGIVNFAPSIYCWYTWSQNDIDFVLPRWIYLQIFIAILHLVYAVLLLQVPDWSTLRSIAVVMLAFAFVFGLFSMGLLATGSNGLLAQFLQVPGSLGRQACIWCVAMLCLATLASYLAGRESNAWQRTEKLLAEILANKESP